MYEVRRLRILHELALRGTLAAVAQALSYSPSTISHQLAQLEKEAGMPLLEPEGRRVRLTPHGHVLAEHARRVLDLEEQAESELRNLDPGGQTIRACVMQSAAQALLPDVLDHLDRGPTPVRLELAEFAPEEGLFELVARGLDLVVAEHYPGHNREHRKGTSRLTLGSDPMRLALPPGDMAQRIDDLRDRAWTMLPTTMIAHHWAVQQCRAAGFEPDVRYEVTDLATQVRLIASGNAVGVLPDLLWSGGRCPVRLLDLPGSPKREVFIATRTAAMKDNHGILAACEAFRSSFENYAGFSRR